MQRIRTVATLGCLALMVVGTASAQRDRGWEWSGRVVAGLMIEIKGINGEIHALSSSGDEVEVSAELREHRRGYAEDISFEVVEHDGGVTVCAVYPTPRRARRSNECLPGDRGTMNTRDNDVEVNFTVRVPAGVGFVGRTVNGEIRVEELASDVQAHTVNGDVELSTSGVAQATTVNGSIWAELGSADWQGSLEFQTVNGGITLELPADVAAAVSARTVNGAIETDFPLTVRGRFSSRRLSGVIGDGGHGLWLETVNGSIRLRSK